MCVRAAALLVIGSLLQGCAGYDLSPLNPTGTDLSGTWVLDFAQSNSVADLGSMSQARGRLGSRREALRIAKGSDLEFVSVDFQVLKADKIQIELSKDSMGIRYFPGVYRDISWGERQRGLWEVNAGWEEGNLLIISDAKDLQVIETLILDGDQLTIEVALDGDGVEREVVRVFNRR